MAIGILQQPSSPNVAFTKLMYTVQASNINYPQYSFVMDVLDDSNNLISRIRTKPNENDHGIINAASFFLKDLNYDNNWKTAGDDPIISGSKTFKVRFGEEYSDSVSGSVVLYDGFGGTGAPAAAGDDIIIFKGTLDPTVRNSWDFSLIPYDTGSFTGINGTDPDATYSQLRGPRLSNCPDGLATFAKTSIPKPLSADDYETITVWAGTNPSGYYIKSGSFQSFTNGGGAVDSGSIFFNVFTPFDDLLTIGVGPQNLYDQGFTSFAGDWDAYRVDLTYTSGSSNITSSYWYSNEIAPSFDSGEETIIIPSQGVWTTSNNTPARVHNIQGAGGQDTAWSAGGSTTGVPITSDVFMKYNGSTWSLGPTCVNPNDHCGNIGTQTSALRVGNETQVEFFNGTAWAVVASLSKTRTTVPGTAGSAADAFVVGGRENSGTSGNSIETFNGTSWTTGINPLVGFGTGTSGGTTTNSVVNARSKSNFGLDIGLNTMSWNGVSFSYITDCNVKADESAGSGNNNKSVITFGGEPVGGGSVNPTTSTEVWNGDAWYTVASMNQKRDRGAGAGDPRRAIAWNGFKGIGEPDPDNNFSVTSEEYNGSGVQPIIDFNLSNNKDLGCESYKRFAFINQYGVWDYMSVRLPLEKETKLKREDVILPATDYSGNTSIYNISARGYTTYYNKPTTSFRISTIWLDEDEAQWMSEMIESPSAYVQEEVNGSSEFKAIVITNKSYKHKTNPRGQKAFQYTLEFEFANQDRART
jgi:hypothetical protein